MCICRDSYGLEYVEHDSLRILPFPCHDLVERGAESVYAYVCVCIVSA